MRIIVNSSTLLFVINSRVFAQTQLRLPSILLYREVAEVVQPEGPCAGVEHAILPRPLAGLSASRSLSAAPGAAGLPAIREHVDPDPCRSNRLSSIQTEHAGSDRALA